jgi:Flp pilus assembly protein TadD
MKTNLARLTLLVLLSGIAAVAFSQTREQWRKSETAKRAKVEKVSFLTDRRTGDTEDVRNEDKDKDNHDGEYWFSHAYSLHQSGHYVEAIDAFSHAIGLGHRQPTCMYNVACGYALLNDKENALFWLDRAFGSGFDRTDLLREDSDLDSLRSDSRFKDIVQRVASAKPEKPEDSSSKKKEHANHDRLNEAIINFEQLRSASSTDGEQWYKTGSRLLAVRDLDRATYALTQAVEHLGYNGASARYNLACAYALKGDRELALDWLEKAINAGFDDTEKVRSDSDTASLRGEARFKKIEEMSRLLSLSQNVVDSDDNGNYSKKRWAPAIKRYESYLRDHSDSGRAWFNLGYALHYSSEHARAIEAFERAIQFEYKPPTSMYNIACANSMMGRKDAAFEWLDKSVQAGFDLDNYIRGDEDLDNLRTDPRFARFIERASDRHKDKHKSEK